MKDDYLWDRTGEPDPEIQQLEEILGELRYQPRSFEIPAEEKPNRERSFFRASGPRLAIAAAIAMLVIGLGAWVMLQQTKQAQTPSVAQTSNQPSNTAPAGSDQTPATVATKSPEPQPERADVPAPRVQRPLPANRVRRLPTRGQELTAREREGLAAKEQLMLAFRLASAKLNLVQKKTQSNQPELIHNQHKTG